MEERSDLCDGELLILASCPVLTFQQFFPQKEKYISLFPKENAEQNDEVRAAMRIKAEQIASRIASRKQSSSRPATEERASGNEEASKESDGSDSEEPIEEDNGAEVPDEEEDDFFL